MKNSDDEKLCDILIGEAVMELLAGDKAISWSSLLKKLQAMLEAGNSDPRIVMMAIEEVKAGMASRSTSGSISMEMESVIGMSANLSAPTKH
ncbi:MULTISPECIES: hypothetical protein [Erwinia]|uniref:Uncharacterized protein n=2 Tax=Erwinia TaxID=551 RepID=A0A014PXY6_9GAMM|nr:hypothetical protein [Erwinia mallotivora]EXU75797.1 hypothetical protein BG55_09245 [Erwinia mallotivora]